MKNSNSSPETMHQPTAEFRAALEEDIVHAFRRQSRFSPMPRTLFRNSRTRSAATLALGLLLGAGAGIATAQAQNARQRDELADSLSAKRQLAALRLQLAQLNLATTQRSVDVGARDRDALSAALLELHSAEANVRKVDLDLEEIRATAAAPRDELWAPLVKDKDYVKERLTLLASVAQQQSSATEQLQSELQRKLQIGAISEVTLSESQEQMAQARIELKLLAQKLELRKQFLNKETTREAIANKVQLLELSADVDRAARRAEIARQRAELVKKRNAVGVATEIELKQAELAVLERSLELDQLRKQLQLLGTPKKKD